MRGPPLVAIEEALGRKLPKLEEEWALWLYDEGTAPGLVQKLRPGVPEQAKGDPTTIAALNKLRAVRERAFPRQELWSETLSLFDELSKNAQAHAHYLTLNPEQGAAWPDAHEEYADREGFTPEGAWAGGHSVIHFVPDPVKAIDGWMGTFYHRLPLINPGLFGIGYGSEGDVTVLDSGSLVAPYWIDTWIVWPPAGASAIPLSFEPELPNPVPGESQSAWGYPITLQVYEGKKKGEQTLEMSLHLGGSVADDLVPCHYLTPTAPKFEKLAPRNAFCLIPKQRLQKGVTYTVSAHCLETGEKLVWSFSTER